jgi:hypothetical protein
LEKTQKRQIKPEEAQSLEDVIAKLKEKVVVLKPHRRRWKRRPTGRKEEYTPEEYKRKVETEKQIWRGLTGTWMHLRKTYASRARLKGQESLWQMSLEEWKALWTAAGIDQYGRTIFSLRGKRTGQSKAYRIDRTKPWTLDNTIVVYEGNVRANGRKVCQQLKDA